MYQDTFNSHPEIARCVAEVVAATPVTDLHTHLYPTQFGGLSLWGIDELLNYHYLIAEMFRFASVKPAQFWALSKTGQADLIWRTLFVERAPLSEATRGIVTVLTKLGLDPRQPDLREFRAFFRAQDPETHLNRVLDLAGVTDVVMTNDPFDAAEVAVWQTGYKPDPRFHAAIRLDKLLNEWPAPAPLLREAGYDAGPELNGKTLREIRRMLEHWVERLQPLYLAVSLPDSFAYPEKSARGTLLTEVVLPLARACDLPLALMIGVRRQVNPALRLAGDGVGLADAGAVERLCADYDSNRFLVTMLARENQHQLCVAARKFSNLLPFGCWWFLNNPSLVKEITQQRLELLGASFAVQHSDARVLEQLIYKWSHTRNTLSEALTDAYQKLRDSGWPLTRPDIENDAARLLSGNFRNWVNLPEMRLTFYSAHQCSGNNL